MLEYMQTDATQNKKMDEALQAIVGNAQATNAILITQNGQYIMSSGDVSFVNTTALAALVAGMFTATREVAKLLGETEFSILFQQGTKRNVHISMINEDVMLLVVFEGVEKTGIVRMHSAHYGREIGAMLKASVVKESLSKPEPDTTPLGVQEATQEVSKEPTKTSGTPMDEGFDAFKEYATSLLDDIFGEE